MDALMTSAASGMRARMDSLEMLANNLANATTAGYKSDREFYNLYVAPEALDGMQGPQASTAPVIERPWTDFQQGTLTPTGNVLDMAIAGKGFFAVNGTGGPLYTRAGNFRLSAMGVLTTAEGYPVRSETGAPLQAGGQGPIEVTPDGTVRQDGQTLGRIALVDFDNPAGLSKTGNNYFQADAKTAPRPATGAEVHQGKLESSNVGAPESAVRLISVMRQFEMLQKAMTIGGEMNRRAVEEVAKVS
jgi:flagellar basal-body rod protein FlgF